MKCHVPGSKMVKNKTIKSETLPSRMAKATITGGDQYARMTGHYGKNGGSKPSGGMGFMGMGRIF